MQERRRIHRTLSLEELEARVVLSSTNYALLFSGGWDVYNNHSRYYDNIRSMYEILVDDCGLQRDNIYVVYADGTDPAVDRSDGLNSDMSYADGSTVLSASSANLQSTLDTLAGAADNDDHFLFYSFDHGSGSDDPSETGEEALCGWGEEIADDVLAGWLSSVNAGYCSYVFTQCFAGGMLDDLTPMGTNRFGCDATNHYESS